MKTALPIVVLTLLFHTSCFASTSYSIEYAPSSPIKDLSLKNAQLNVEIYSYANPSGFINVSTDANQTFSLDKKHDLEVVSIKGEDKYNARCSGYGTIDNNKIQITCTPKNHD